MLKRRRIYGANSLAGESLAMLGNYGDGWDGDVVFSSGTNYLFRDMYYKTLRIKSGAVLDTQSYRIFVKDTLYLESGAIIRNNGADGDPSGAFPVNGSDGTLGAGASGGYGGNGPDTSPGDPNGGDGDTSSSSIGGSGGAGGQGIPGLAGAGGIVSFLAASTGGLNQTGIFWGLMRGTVSTSYTTKVRGGAGGGGGGGNGTDAAPSGGCGGGVVLIIARYIRGASGAQITARGGNGPDIEYPNTGAGGGGGGGGILVFTDTPYDQLSDITFDASGGLGGSGDIIGDGQNGSAGSVVIVAGDF